jgi:helicase MOV-10
LGSRRYNATPAAAAENQVEWSEKPYDEYQQPFSNAEVGPEEETQKQHVEQEPGEGDEQSNQYSTNDGQLQDAYVEKYTFPPGWGDVSNIPATGWD